jgi:serine protease Do
LVDYFDHIRNVNLDAQVNQDVPFEQLVQQFGSRSQTHAELVQILLSMNTAEQGQLVIPGLDIRLSQSDVVAKFDGRKIDSARQLFEMLEGVTPKQKLKLELWRDGSSETVSVHAEEIPENVSEELANRLLGVHLKQHQNGGYEVTSVRRKSAAEGVGLQEGDLILGVNGVPLQNAEALKRAMLNLRGRERALVLVRRGPGRYHVTIPLR